MKPIMTIINVPFLKGDRVMVLKTQEAGTVVGELRDCWEVHTDNGKQYLAATYTLKKL